MENKRNLILFIVISAIIFGAWQFLYVIPYQEKQPALQKQEQAQHAAQQAAKQAATASAAQGTTAGANGAAAPSAFGQPLEMKSRPDALAMSPRVPIDAPRVSRVVNSPVAKRSASARTASDGVPGSKARDR